MLFLEGKCSFSILLQKNRRLLVLLFLMGWMIHANGIVVEHSKSEWRGRYGLPENLRGCIKGCDKTRREIDKLVAIMTVLMIDGFNPGVFNQLLLFTEKPNQQGGTILIQDSSIEKVRNVYYDLVALFRTYPFLMIHCMDSLITSRYFESFAALSIDIGQVNDHTPVSSFSVVNMLIPDNKEYFQVDPNKIYECQGEYDRIMSRSDDDAEQLIDCLLMLDFIPPESKEKSGKINGKIIKLAMRVLRLFAGFDERSNSRLDGVERRVDQNHRRVERGRAQPFSTSDECQLALQLEERCKVENVLAKTFDKGTGKSSFLDLVGCEKKRKAIEYVFKIFYLVIRSNDERLEQYLIDDLGKNKNKVYLCQFPDREEWAVFFRYRHYFYNGDIALNLTPGVFFDENTFWRKGVFCFFGYKDKSYYSNGRYFARPLCLLTSRLSEQRYKYGGTSALPETAAAMFVASGANAMTEILDERIEGLQLAAKKNDEAKASFGWGPMLLVAGMMKAMAPSGSAPNGHSYKGGFGGGGGHRAFKGGKGLTDAVLSKEVSANLTPGGQAKQKAGGKPKASKGSMDNKK